MEIHGCSGLILHDESTAYPEFAVLLRDLLEPMAVEAIQFCGRYEPQNLNERMAGVDVVVMGSTWYENAPMVIQEAFCMQGLFWLQFRGNVREGAGWPLWILFWQRC